MSNECACVNESDRMTIPGCERIGIQLDGNLIRSVLTKTPAKPLSGCSFEARIDARQ
jgi:hypothetical protein